MKKLLVTGASGFLGWNICNLFHDTWSIYGICFTRCIDIQGVNIIQADLRDFHGLKEIFWKTRPDAVIHAAAVTDPNYCQENRDETAEINVTASINIAGLCSDHNIPCVFTSTDIVFDGLNPPYREEDPVSPVSFYGEQKVMAEEGVLKRYPEAAVCRLPLMFGDPGPVASSFFQSMITAMREGREVRLFVDECRTPVSGPVAARGLFLALDHVKGILHLGGKERISRYDFGLLLKKVSGLESAQLKPVRQKDMAMPAPRPRDVSLDSSKAFSLGFKPLDLAEELREVIHFIK